MASQSSEKQNLQYFQHDRLTGMYVALRASSVGRIAGCLAHGGAIAEVYHKV